MKTLAVLVFALVAGCGGMPAEKKAFGVTCAADGDCESNVCYVGGMESYCSVKCTTATMATDCPTPLTSGMCNMKGFCKK